MNPEAAGLSGPEISVLAYLLLIPVAWVILASVAKEDPNTDADDIWAVGMIGLIWPILLPVPFIALGRWLRRRFS